MLKLRILHVVPTYLPALRYGGPIISVHGLCKALVRRGHEVHVYTTNVDGAGESDVPTGTPVDLDGVKVWYFSVPGLRRLYWSPAMKAALSARMGSFDIVHTHSVFLWPTWAAARAARHRQVPYMLAPRGMLVRDLIRRKSRGLKHLWIRLIEQDNLRHAAAIHATSELEAEDLRAFGFVLPPIEVVPNGVDLATERGIGPADERGIDLAADRAGLLPDAAATTSAGARLHELMNAPYLLFIGRINWKKGLDRLLPALAALPDIRLLIAGNDEENYQPVLEAQAQACGVAQRTHFLGPVYGTDKLALLRGAQALVLPSYSENFGNVVLEAMAAGCPVVLTAAVGAAEIVSQSGAGLVVSGEAPELAQALRQITTDGARRNHMGRLGLATVRERFSWDAIAQSMEACYGRAIDRTGGHAIHEA